MGGGSGNGSDLETMSLRRAVTEYLEHYNYASYCPPRYVIDKSKNAWSCDANAGVRFFVRIRSTNWAAATVSSARRLRTQGPALNASWRSYWALLPDWQLKARQHHDHAGRHGTGTGFRTDRSRDTHLD